MSDGMKNYSLDSIDKEAQGVLARFGILALEFSRWLTGPGKGKVIITFQLLLFQSFVN